MQIGSAFLRSTYVTVDLVLAIVEWTVFIWVILSWVLLFASNSSFRWKYRSAYRTLDLINDFFSRATRPLLAPFRRLLPPWKTAGIDWSPLLLLVAIFFLRTFLRLAFAPMLF